MPDGQTPKNPRTAFGERLRKARKKSGLKQKHVAAQMGVKQHTYARWERHPIPLTSLQVEQLASIVKTTAPELFGGLPATSDTGALLTRKWRDLLKEISQLPQEEQAKYYETISTLVKR